MKHPTRIQPSRKTTTYAPMLHAKAQDFRSKLEHLPKNRSDAVWSLRYNWNLKYQWASKKKGHSLLLGVFFKGLMRQVILLLKRSPLVKCHYTVPF